MNAIVLESTLLAQAGFRHGFATRQGGVSAGPFASLSFGLAPGRATGQGDSAENVRENVRRLAAAVGFDAAELYQASQVHGADVMRAEGDPARVIETKADAVVAFASAGAANDSPARTPCAGIRVADCTPVLVADPESGAVAAIHAGWRGVVAKVVAAGVGALASRSVKTLIAAIGPGLCAQCFEVGDDVAAQIAAGAGDARDGGVIVRGYAKPHVDMRRAVRAQLHALGLDDARIDDVAGCTRCDAARFFSYRRDGELSGRHLAVIRARVLNARP